MAIIKGTSTKKFSKARTDLDVPAIARSAQVAQGLSLTSSADIDIDNPENLYFHILGDLPAQILLFIYGERFNQNFYTELGIHNHGPGSFATGNVASGTTTHNHGATGSAPSHAHTGSTDTEAAHRHFLRLEFDVNDTNYHIDVNSGSGYNSDGNPIMGTAGSHSHGLSIGSAGSFAFGSYLSINNTTINTHGHLVSAGLSSNTGLAPFFGSLHLTGTAKSYFDAMKIAIDGVDRTAALLTQASLVKFGDGTSGHVIVTTGVQLDLLPFISTPGQHKVTFSLNTGSSNNGGKIRYNLYTVA